MPKCYHCGEEVLETYPCGECGQNYCSLHKDPINHDCNIVRESLSTQQYAPFASSPTYVGVPQTTPSLQERIYQQQAPPREFQQQYASESGSEVRGTTDGSFTWFHQEKFIPANAFDPDSGIHFKGILLPHKSEFLHLVIGATLIFIIGLLGFYNPTNQQILESMGYGWAIFMLAGFYTTAFLFHEFGHRQVAKHFKLQTKFRLLTFGMALTIVSLTSALMTLYLGTTGFPSLALPGAVVVLGLDKVDRKTGLCKVAGPLVNLVYGIALLIISFIMPRDLYPLNMFIGLAALLNFILGGFNMLPIGILDGQNIFKWNKPLYVILAVTFLLLILITWANVYAEPCVSLYIPEEIQKYYCSPL